MDPTRSGSESDDSNPASSVSPTPTVRESRYLAPVESRPVPHIPAPIHTGSQVQHQDLGMGRPEVSHQTRRTCWGSELTSDTGQTTFYDKRDITSK